MESFSKSDCIYYDWGKTAPSAYGAFCQKHGDKPLRSMTHTLCVKCKDYVKEKKK